METDKDNINGTQIALRIGRDIRDARQRKGWSQLFLAKQVGLKCGSTIQRFEVGKRYPEFLLLLKLAKILDLQVEEIIADTLGRELPSSATEEKYRSLARALVTSDALTSSDPMIRDFVTQQIEHLDKDDIAAAFLRLAAAQGKSET